jgi:hypothetical protein
MRVAARIKQIEDAMNAMKCDLVRLPPVQDRPIRLPAPNVFLPTHLPPIDEQIIRLPPVRLPPIN